MGETMKLLIQGTKSFNQYEIFINAVGRSIRSMDPEDSELKLMTLGPANINSMAYEFTNISEDTLRANGIRAKVIKVTRAWVKENIDELDEFIYLCNPKEPLSDMATLIDKKGRPDMHVFRY
jgi:hypothetical protein